MLTRPDRLQPDHAVDLADLSAGCPELAAAAGHVRSFAAMMQHRRGERLTA